MKYSDTAQPHAESDPSILLGTFRMHAVGGSRPDRHAHRRHVYRISEEVYLNSWVAIHLPVSGNHDVMFANNNYALRILLEASVKLGFRF